MVDWGLFVKAAEGVGVEEWGLLMWKVHDNPAIDCGQSLHRPDL